MTIEIASAANSISSTESDKANRPGTTPAAHKMRELDFTAGQLDGHWLEWGTAKNLTMNETYQDGQRLAKKIETHPNGQTKSEGTYLFAREVLKTNYDWWNGTVTTTAQKEGKDQKHGLCTTWYKNGQKETEGQYVNDLPVGHFTWWHSNGQKAVEGQYASGDRVGSWTWWHQNGQKAVGGEFVKGVEIGKWTWWKEDGKVANSARITEGQSSLAADESISIDSTVDRAPSGSRDKACCSPGAGPAQGARPQCTQVTLRKTGQQPQTPSRRFGAAGVFCFRQAPVALSPRPSNGLSRQWLGRQLVEEFVQRR